MVRTSSILIVEDFKMSQVILESHLRKINPKYHITTVNSTASALVAATERNFDLIFLDIQLPGMDGFGFVNVLLAGPIQECPVIAYTATNYSKETLLEKGFTDCIFKPINLEVINHVIVTHLI